MVYNKHHLRPSETISKPDNFELMKDLASRLSKGFPQIRVDFYEVDGKVYIGELTMTSACGRMDYFTDSCLSHMGEKCGLAVRRLLAS